MSVRQEFYAAMGRGDVVNAYAALNEYSFKVPHLLSVDLSRRFIVPARWNKESAIDLADELKALDELIDEIDVVCEPYRKELKDIAARLEIDLEQHQKRADELHDALNKKGAFN